MGEMDDQEDKRRFGEEREEEERDGMSTCTSIAYQPA